MIRLLLLIVVGTVSCQTSEKKAEYKSSNEDNGMALKPTYHDYSVYVDPPIPHFSGQSDPPISRCERVK